MQEAHPTAHPTARVLIVDDEVYLREAIGDYLEDSGYEPLFAADGEEGLAVFERERPDALLVDLNMPRVDGFQVLERLSRDAPETPIIVVSGVGVVHEALKAVRLGAWDFITKPVGDMEVLEHALSKSLERARLIRENRLYREHLEEEVRKRTHELSVLNQELEERVELRTRELEASLDNLKNAQEQLVQSEKMASLGNLVAGVAHEINTPVGIGVTAASFLSDKTRDFERRYTAGELKRSEMDAFIRVAVDSSEAILSNLGRAADLIQSFKQVAVDQTSGEKRRFDLGEYLREVLLSLRPKYKRTRHDIRVDCPEGIELVGEPGAFMQIVINLVMNSLTHAFDEVEQGHISLSVEPDGDNLRLVYKDDGKGMEAETARKIFDPFFTTRRGRGGTGLGMHIVYNLVTRVLEGAIVCESSPGNGTVFTITIPWRR